MLSPSSAATVRTTLPAVGAAIDDIASVFYERLFQAHPELLSDLFNRGNQASGTQKRALAGSIAAFAGFLLDHPGERPDVLLSRIADKHVSLGIRPEQYEIVHRHLFAAIAQVLGDAVTPEVAAAWDEVYWLMANTLIALEAGRYQGDPYVFAPWTVVARGQRTPDVITLALAPSAGPVPAFQPGQFVSVQVRLPDGARQIRQYSVTASDPGTLSVSVKRDGEVSGWLHEHAGFGTVLAVSRPSGRLAFDTGEEARRPLLLASAGIGITPMVGMLHHLVATGATRRVVVLHADRSPQAHAHRAQVAELVGRLADAESVTWYERTDGFDHEPVGRMDLGGVAVPAGAVAYLCGPVPFMAGVRDQLLSAGLAGGDIHHESFSPDLGLG
jgi:nitric oxide dioxygenase